MPNIVLDPDRLTCKIVARGDILMVECFRESELLPPIRVAAFVLYRRDRDD